MKLQRLNDITKRVNTLDSDIRILRDDISRLKCFKKEMCIFKETVGYNELGEVGLLYSSIATLDNLLRGKCKGKTLLVPVDTIINPDINQMHITINNEDNFYRGQWTAKAVVEVYTQCVMTEENKAKRTNEINKHIISLQEERSALLFELAELGVEV